MNVLKALVATTVILISAFARADATVPAVPGGSEGTVVAKVSIATQTMRVYVGKELLYEWSVSTARRGYKTPPGRYKPYWLDKDHHSSVYDNEPMPYAVFYRGNYAVHGTTDSEHLGHRASHGCVRLLTENARIFYTLVQQYGKQNTRIIIES